MSTETYIPPQNLDAEMSVLGSMMIDSRAVDEVADLLEVQHFYSDRHARIYSAILRMHNEARPVDAVSLAQELTNNQELEDAGGPETLHKILSIVPHAAHAAHYAEIVREKATRREIMQSGRRMLGDASDESMETNICLSRAESDLHQIIEGRLGGNTAADLQALLVEAYEQITSGQAQGLRIGYPDMDSLLHGFHPGNLIILAARPSVGKTAMAINLCLRFAGAATEPEEQNGVLFISLEQSRIEITERILSMESEVPSHLIRSHDINEEQRETLLRTATRISNMPIRIDDSPQRTVTQISATARLMVRRHNVRLLVVDYLQLIRPEDKKVHREQQVAEMTRGLKLLARQLEIPVIALAQLNRQVEQRTNKRPMMSDLRESGAIEQDADIIMFLDRPSLYDQGSHPGEARLIVAKHRNGQTGDIQFVWDAATTRFLPAAPEYHNMMGGDF